MYKQKYQLRCVKCGYITPNFATWFSQEQCCPKCGSKQSDIEYSADYSALTSLFEGSPISFWHYFDFLPLYDKKNIISCQEGAIPLERWTFLEEYAKKKKNVDCQVFVYRNDLNGGTNTFKDIAASMAASVLKEIGVDNYCIPSTGNSATAYGKYLALAGINAAIFMPENAEIASQAEISSYGQQVYRAQGDYAFAKKMAGEFATKHKIPISAGNIDPIRIESKRTMVFEWLRQIGKMPDVYVQAISGGTGPLAIDKAVRELKKYRSDIQLPKMLLVQSNKCDPMVQAWENAVKNNFPDGFEKDYPIIDNPQTKISILATGNPGTYPIIAKLVHSCNGNFYRINEEKTVDMAQLIAFERKIHIGPASAVAFLGFFKALDNNEIQNGQIVLINMGEGIKRNPKFLNAIGHHIVDIEDISQCRVPNINENAEELWENATN